MTNDDLQTQPLRAQLPSRPELRAPTTWAAVGLIALYLMSQAVIGGILVRVIALIHRFRAPDITARAASEIAVVLRQPGMGAALTIIAVCTAALVVVLLVRRRWPRLWARATPPGFGISQPRQPSWLALAVAIGVLAPLLGGVLTQFLANGHEISQDIQQLTQNAPLAWRVALALMAISLAPLTEELLFRGVLLSALIPRCGMRLAVLLSAAGFAAIHLPGLQWQWYALPELIALGVVLAWLRVHYQSLWPAVLAHGTHNAMALAAGIFALNVPS